MRVLRCGISIQPMSQLGQSRSFDDIRAMSGLPPQADVRAFLRGQLPPGQTEELHNQLLATGIPLHDRAAAAGHQSVAGEA